MDTCSLECAAPSAPELPIPSDAQAAIDAWRGFKAAADEYWTKFLTLRAAEQAALGEGEDSRDYNLVMYEYEARIDVEKIAERALGRLVRVAECEFAPSGARLEISVPRKADLPAADPKCFEPEAVWRYLANTYGGDSGANAAYSRAAKSLGSNLCISVGCEPRQAGGRSVFERRVYADRIFNHVLSYQDAESLNEILDGFLAVGKWSGLWSTAEVVDARAARSYIQQADRSKVLPGRHSIGESILIIPFKSKWEFRVSPAFAEQMQIFLSQFNGYDRSFSR